MIADRREITGRLGRGPVGGWLLLLLFVTLAGAGVLIVVRALATRPAPSAVDLWAVASSDAIHIVAVGGTDDSRGALVVATSNDGGANWTVASPPGPALTTLATAGEMLLGGTECYQSRTDSGPIEPAPTSCLFASDDGGRSWYDLNVGRLVDPSFIDERTGWAHTPIDVGLSTPATLFATTDGGRSWQEAGHPCTGVTPWIHKAVLVSPGHGYVLCQGGAQNGGSSYPWQLLELTAGGNTVVHQQGDTYAPGAPFGGDDVYGVGMLADGHGYLLTQKVWRTGDGGQTWAALATGKTVGSFESVVMIDDSTAFVSLRALGNYTRIYGTSDGGDSWALLGSWPFY